MSPPWLGEARGCPLYFTLILHEYWADLPLLTPNETGMDDEMRSREIEHTDAGFGTGKLNGWLRYTAAGNDELVIAPASYGPRGAGASIRYSIAESPLGRTLLAATPHGLCWLGLAAPDDRLEAELRGDYPAANFGRDDAMLAPFIDTILDFVDGSRPDLDLPLDLRATPFEAAVWHQLCLIPRGLTRSYGAIAERLGNPNASRAVGHANGANPLAIVIPCHRAIGSDGSLTGYRWGLDVKRRLLEHERALIQTSLALNA
jgi:AraC family transcriptional regulator of adaptative response/methylated-DNA-[protein]-cysteine methyltransferase